MAKINYKGNVIELSSEYQGTAKPWDGKYEKQHHVVYVDMDDQHTWFDFYCNDACLDEEGEVEAFYDFISDGICYDNAKDIDDFQDEFGFTKVSRCIDAYEGCEDAHLKWVPFGIDAIELSNWLQDKYDL